MTSEFINQIFSKMSLFHLNALLLLGLALFGGMVGGRIFQKLRIPQVVGYIIIGIVIGRSGFGIVDEEIIVSLAPFNYFALGLIGFMVGGELKREVFAKYGKQFLYILLCEGITPFILVTVFTGLVGSLIFGSSPFVWALALLLGAISSATDPASTSSVLKEYKTRGPLTSTILGIVALDDGLALFLFTLASSVVGVLLGHASESPLLAILYPFYEIFGAIFIGAVSGIFLSKILKKYSEKERILAFSIGTVLLVTGLSLAMNVSMLLAVMTLGVIVTNFTYNKSKEIFGLVEGFTPPIYVLFFVLVGAKLNIANMNVNIILLVLTYLIFGMLGKALGAWVGARLSGAPKTVVRFLPFALFSQAGVAIGLSILAAQHFVGSEGIGSMLVIIIAATTFITQLIGPSFTKFAVIKAEEVDLNITEEDIIRKSKVTDIMDKNPPVIFENMQVSDILRIFSANDNLYYPVINKDRKLCGIITVEGIKQTFMEMDIEGLVLAYDLMEPVTTKAFSSDPLEGVSDEINKQHIEYIPVVDKEDRLEGFIEKRIMEKFIYTKMIELQKRADSLDSTI